MKKLVWSRYLHSTLHEWNAGRKLPRKKRKWGAWSPGVGRSASYTSEWKGEKFNSSLCTFCTVFALDKTGHTASKGFCQHYVLLKSESIREKCRLRRICTFHVSLHCSKMADFEAIQSLHRMKYVSECKLCCFIASKWRIIKRYNILFHENLSSPLSLKPNSDIMISTTISRPLQILTASTTHSCSLYWLSHGLHSHFYGL